MKYCKLLLLLTVCLFAACTNSSIESVTTKEEYLDKLEKLSDKARKEQLMKDIDYLTILLQSTQKIKVYNENFSKTNIQRTDSLILSYPFSLLNRDSIEHEFDTFVEAHAVQQYGVPYSTFDVQILDSLTFIDRDYFLFKPKSIYRNGETIDPLSISLTAVDSVLMGIDYKFVTSVDTVSISALSASDSILYKTSRIDIVDKTDKSLTFIYPLDIDLIDYRAINLSDSTSMLYKSYSDFSIFSISHETNDTIKHLIQILVDASQETDKESAFKKLNDLSDQEFLYYDALRNFKTDYDKEASKHGGENLHRANKMSATFIEKYKILLSPVSKELTLTFSKPYSRVLLYIVSAHKTISRELIMPVQKDLYPSFQVYKDRENNKYGVIDKDKKVVIPAQYDLLLQNENLYYSGFLSKEDGQNLSYYLDTTKKVLNAFPSDIRFVKVLNPQTTVFENNKGKKGVLSKNKVEIVPYRYDDISLYGKTIVAKGTSSNDLFYELFNISGKKINLPQIKSVSVLERNPNVIIRTVDGKEGVINKEGVATIRPLYYGLKFIKDDLLKYNIDPTYDEYSAKDYLWGVVRVDGEEISKPKYYSIGFFAEDMAPVYIKSGEKLRGGYINVKGEIAIEPKFLFVNQFYKGYALVRLEENYSLINKQGKVVKNFPKGTYVELVDHSNPSMGSLYETSDGIDYDFQGKVIK